MRRVILTLAIIGLFVSVSLASYLNHGKKVAATQKCLNTTKIDSVSDYAKFKSEADVKISENRIKIAALKEKTANESKEVNEDYDLKILALEQKNNELEVRINNTTDTRKSMWVSFMREFNHDMDELIRALKEMGI